MTTRKREKKETICAVLISGMFPTSDPIAIDLLRLMSGCNDIYLLNTWIRATMQNPRTFFPRTIATGRISFQLRLLLSCLHESLVVLNDLIKRPRFAVLRSLLDSQEENALLELSKIKLKGVGFTTKHWDLDESILRARHTATFHYDFARTRETLDSWLRDRGSKEKGYILVGRDRDGLKGRSYYSVADMVRADAALGLGNQQYAKNLSKLSSLIDCLTVLADGIFIAYVKHNKLEQFIREEKPLRRKKPTSVPLN
jgi:hypothetical protein